MQGLILVFYDNFLRVCGSKGTTPTSLLRSLGLSSGLLGKWKGGSTPNSETVKIIAKELGVSVDSLLDNNPAAFSSAAGDVKIDILARAARKMTEEEKDKLIEMAKVLFKKAFDE